MAKLFRAGGSNQFWQNPTNWYYNPETKEFVDFGENKPIPCAAINLSEPVRSPVIDSQNKGDDLKEPSKAEAESTESVKPSRREDVGHHSETKSQSKTAVPPPEVHEGFGDKVLRAVDAVKEFSERHPILTGIVKWGGIAAAAITNATVAHHALRWLFAARGGLTRRWLLRRRRAARGKWPCNRRGNCCFSETET